MTISEGTLFVENLWLETAVGTWFPILTDTLQLIAAAVAAYSAFTLARRRRRRRREDDHD